MTYEPRMFQLPELDGLSAAAIENHLGLYKGYVKHVNVVQEKIAALASDKETNALAVTELQRHFAFEFCGMRNHEYYFEQFEGGASALPEGPLKTKLEATWGSVENWLAEFRQLALTRGIGWAILYRDQTTGELLQTWVDDHQVGQLAGLEIILALDMWEHAYLRDYLSADKGQYIDAVFRNMNWEVVARRVN